VLSILICPVYRCNADDCVIIMLLCLVLAGLPVACRKALEAMSAELNGMNPSFTIRRNMQHALDDRFLVDELRKVIAYMIHCIAAVIIAQVYLVCLLSFVVPISMCYCESDICFI